MLTFVKSEQENWGFFNFTFWELNNCIQKLYSFCNLLTLITYIYWGETVKVNSFGRNIYWTLGSLCTKWGCMPCDSSN
jgi:hypothetical protein